MNRVLSGVFERHRPSGKVFERFGRLKCLLALSLVAASAWSAAPVHAGWSFTQEWTGEKTTYTDSPYNVAQGFAPLGEKSSNFTYTPATAPPGYTPGLSLRTGCSPYPPINYTTWVRVKAKCTLVGVWQGSAGEIVPTRVSVRVLASAVASVDYNPISYPSHSATGSASNSQGDGAIEFESLPEGDGQRRRTFTSGSVLTSPAPLGGVLKTVSVGRPDASGKLYARIALDEMTATATLVCRATGNNDFTNSQVSVSCTVRALVDNRSVQIDSPTIETSYFKNDDGSLPANMYRGGVKPAQGPYAVKNERNADYSLNVDSVCNWNDSTNSWAGVARIQSNEQGYTSPSEQRVRRWTQAGGNFGSAQPFLMHDLNGQGRTSFDASIYLGGDRKGVGRDGNTEFTVKVTDADSAVAQSRYMISWHKPREDVTEIARIADVKADVYEASGWNGEWANPGNGTTGTFNISKYAVLTDLVNLGGDALQIGAGLAQNSKVAVGLAAIGYLATKVDFTAEGERFGSITNSDPASSTTAPWHEARLLQTKGWHVTMDTSNTQEPWQSWVWSDCVMTKPLMTLHFDDVTYKWDAYDIKGYIGERKTKSTESNGPPRQAGVFKLWVDPSDGGLNPGDPS